MLLLSRSWMIVMAAVLACVCTACQSKTTPSKEESPKKSGKLLMPENAIVKESPPESGETRGERQAGASEKKKVEQPVPPLTIPKVSLSNELRATCLVDVGQKLPEAKLPDLNGKIHALDSLYGSKLTVVCFWTIGASHRSRLVADALLHDLASDIAGPLAGEGVGVVAVNVGDDPAAVDKMVSQNGVELPYLVDPRGDYFARIAKDGRMPRTFLLDANGRILWFDIEYSRPSRRELLQCIQVALEKL